MTRLVAAVVAILLLMAVAMQVAATHHHKAHTKEGSVVPSDLLHVFDRPAEPIFTRRGIDRQVAFEVPASYVPECYKQHAAEVLGAARRRHGVRLIPVPDLGAMPAERFADVNAALPFRSAYSRSSLPQLALAVRFWHFFEESETVPELLARVVWARLHYNPEMVLDGFMMAMLRSPLEEVKDVPLPDLPQYYPELYVDDEFFAKAREQMYTLPEKYRVPIPVARNNSKDVEAPLWYFREDPNFALNHWRWHVLYPANADDPEYIDGPRRGELFVQMHRQIIARYIAERFTNDLPATLPLEIHKPLPNGYFPKMFHVHGSKGTLARQANSSLLLEASFVKNHDLQVARYKSVLEDGFVVYANGSRARLQGIKGLDIVGNLLEGNALLSPNYAFYGSIHNNMHGGLAKAHDPLGVYMEPNAVTTYITAVNRDPAFFNIHQTMDDLFELYKRKFLSPYTKEEMVPLPGVELRSVRALSEGDDRAGRLRTHWQLTDLDVSLGLDYTPPGRQYARFTHLQHQPFYYELEVVNNGQKDKRVFVRLFLLMVEDDKGAKLDLDFQRRFAIQMDIFDTLLSPGSNTVRRASRDSALTVDTDATYSAHPGNASEARRRNACRCGWTAGLLLPRGTPCGTPYKLFAMVSDHDQDAAPPSTSEVCRDGWMFCGAPGNARFPDERPMGFPFDRPFRRDVAKLDDFLSINMAVSHVEVTFEDRAYGPTALLPGGASTSWLSTSTSSAE